MKIPSSRLFLYFIFISDLYNLRICQWKFLSERMLTFTTYKDIWGKHAITRDIWWWVWLLAAVPIVIGWLLVRPLFDHQLFSFFKEKSFLQAIIDAPLKRLSHRKKKTFQREAFFCFLKNNRNVQLHPNRHHPSNIETSPPWKNSPLFLKQLPPFFHRPLFLIIIGRERAN